MHGLQDLRGASARLLPSLAFLFSAGCATIVSGGSQKVRLTSNPSGAMVTVDGSTQRATTPGEIVLPRNTSGYVLHFRKEGYEDSKQRLQSTMNGWVWGNLVFGGLIGLIVDFSSGAANSLTPGAVHVEMKPGGGPPPLSRAQPDRRREDWR
jgi:hypothetical protein